MRDSGCSGAVVKRKYVKDEELTGEEGIMVLVDNTVRKAPFALITVDTPYYSEKMRVLCLPDAVYDPVIGNVSVALPPGLRFHQIFFNNISSFLQFLSQLNDIFVACSCLLLLNLLSAVLAKIK